jgi:hypothetical protein
MLDEVFAFPDRHQFLPQAEDGFEEGFPGRRLFDQGPKVIRD